MSAPGGGAGSAVIALGGHLRVGLEDAPLGCTATNEELVLAAARAVQAAGRRLASAPEIRRSTGVSRPTDRPTDAAPDTR